MAELTPFSSRSGCASRPSCDAELAGVLFLTLGEFDGRDRPLAVVTVYRNTQTVKFIEPNVLKAFAVANRRATHSHPNLQIS
jgi:hypothetical protein